MINIKKFLPFGNAFLPPSETISLKGFPILYPLKQENICYCYPWFIISSGLMFDDIIVNIIWNKKLEYRNEEDDCFL